MLCSALWGQIEFNSGLVLYSPVPSLFNVHPVLHLPLSLWLFWFYCSFIADILLNFRTTFVSRKGEVVSNSKQIAINYFRGWFALDLLAALPFDHLYASDLYDGEVSNCFRIVLKALTKSELLCHFTGLMLASHSTANSCAAATQSVCVCVSEREGVCLSVCVWRVFKMH